MLIIVRRIAKYGLHLNLLFLLLLVVACAPANNPNEHHGEILVWHTWDSEDARVLSDLLAKFEEANPRVTILQTAVSPEALPSRLQSAVESGLAPDLLIGNSRDLPQYVNSGLLRPIEPDFVLTDSYLPTALDTLRYQDALYALPLSLRPFALYYNKELVSQPAQSVDALLTEALNGRSVAINSSFDGAFWGIQAFGGQFFAPSGDLLFNEGGFVNWLSWLATARDAPGVLISSDADFLIEQFTFGQVAYLTADPLALSTVVAQLGSENVGVVPLPAGPVGVAGPLLRVEALYFGRSSSEHQHALALELAQFLTTIEQSRTLMRQTGRVPANASMQVSEQAFPTVANFLIQARTAVPVRFYDDLPEAQQVTEELYTAVLDRGVAPSEAVLALQEELGMPIVAAPPPTKSSCDQTGELQIAHSLDNEAEQYLMAIAEAYEALCPTVQIVLQRTLAEDLIVVFQAKSRANSNSHLLLAPDGAVVQLALDGDIQPITALTTPEILQRYLPAAQEATRFDGNLYGLPFSLELQLFYINNSLVSTPPLSINNLLAQTSIDQPLGLPLGFAENFWGVGSFGGLAIEDNGRFAPSQPALVQLLTWLRQAQSELQVSIEENDNELIRDFGNERLALLIASSSQLAPLQATLGNRLTVATLPAGSSGVATPLLSTSQFLLASNLSTAERVLAYDFALFATTQANQQRLLQETNLIPVNVTVNTEANPLVAAALRQAEAGIAWPKTPAVDQIFVAGEAMIFSVITEGDEIETAVCRFISQVNQLNNFEDDGDCRNAN